mmetsp:Transcript_36763/g.54009  ORF Transcript_36763/g.54009 Transcript_36763/m.54009 type:complete len:87 (+) Transcript_36763:558-818(+)
MTSESLCLRQMSIQYLTSNAECLQEVMSDEPRVVSDPGGGRRTEGSFVQRADSHFADFVMEEWYCLAPVYLHGGFDGIGGTDQNSP